MCAKFVAPALAVQRACVLFPRVALPRSRMPASGSEKEGSTYPNARGRRTTIESLCAWEGKKGGDRSDVVYVGGGGEVGGRRCGWYIDCYRSVYSVMFFGSGNYAFIDLFYVIFKI